MFVMEYWASFNGWCLTVGQRPKRLNFADFCDLVYYWASRHASEEDRAKLDEALGKPPAGENAETPGWSREEQMAAFNAF